MFLPPFPITAPAFWKDQNHQKMSQQFDGILKQWIEGIGQKIIILKKKIFLHKDK